MLPFHFENPPALGEKKGGNSVEAGLMEMLDRMEHGRFKVFNTLYDWFEEYRMYHRKDGKLVKLKDDLMSATRYATMSLRHSTTQNSRWNNVQMSKISQRIEQGQRLFFGKKSLKPFAGGRARIMLNLRKL